MSKLQEKLTLYETYLRSILPTIDTELLGNLTKSLGPAIYRPSSEIVQCEEPKQIAKIRTSFLKMRLGVDKDDEILDEAIKQYCSKLSEPKYRAALYYLLVKHFKKEHLFI